MCSTKSQFNCSPKKILFWWAGLIQFFCNWNSPPKKLHLPVRQVKTELSSPIAKSTSPTRVIRHYFLWRLHSLICKYAKTKTEKVTKDILSYLWNNMSFTSTLRLNCLANFSASSNLCLWSNLDNLKKRQSCHDYELQPMTSVQNFNMENNTTTTLPVFRECFCKRPDSQAGNLLCTA